MTGSSGGRTLAVVRRWREAMAEALYGPEGFFVRPGAGPAGHFRTSAHASPGFGRAVAELLERLDRALGHPDPLEVVDIGAGRGELLSTLHAALPAPVAARLRPVAVELSPPPAGDPALDWRKAPPERITGLLLATEWLDNIPVEVVEVDDTGEVRYVLVAPATGAEAIGDPVTGADAAWLARWWPLRVPGSRAEIGRDRDAAWAAAMARLAHGAALAVDYGHERGARPPLGTLTGFRDGREVAPVPDGSCDLTAHVAVDAVAAASRPGGTAGRTEAGRTGGFRHPPVLCRQADALPTLGVDGRRPPLAQAGHDPAGYLRRLATASAATELTDPAGLGGHFWLWQPVGFDPAGTAVDVTGWLA